MRPDTEARDFYVRRGFPREPRLMRVRCDVCGDQYRVEAFDPPECRRCRVYMTEVE